MAKAASQMRIVGVSKARGRWQAHIWLSQKAAGSGASAKGRQEHVGTFHTEEEACMAHDIVQLFVYKHIYGSMGEAPRLNHPELRAELERRLAAWEATVPHTPDYRADLIMYLRTRPGQLELLSRSPGPRGPRAGPSAAAARPVSPPVAQARAVLPRPAALPQGVPDDSRMQAMAAMAAAMADNPRPGDLPGDLGLFVDAAVETRASTGASKRPPAHADPGPLPAGSRAPKRPRVDPEQTPASTAGLPPPRGSHFGSHFMPPPLPPSMAPFFNALPPRFDLAQSRALGPAALGVALRRGARPSLATDRLSELEDVSRLWHNSVHEVLAEYPEAAMLPYASHHELVPPAHGAPIPSLGLEGLSEDPMNSWAREFYRRTPLSTMSRASRDEKVGATASADTLPFTHALEGTRQWMPSRMGWEGPSAQPTGREGVAAPPPPAPQGPGGVAESLGRAGPSYAPPAGAAEFAGPRGGPPGPRPPADVSGSGVAAPLDGPNGAGWGPGSGSGPAWRAPVGPMMEVLRRVMRASQAEGLRAGGSAGGFGPGGPVPGPGPLDVLGAGGLEGAGGGAALHPDIFRGLGAFLSAHGGYLGAADLQRVAAKSPALNGFGSAASPGLGALAEVAAPGGPEHSAPQPFLAVFPAHGLACPPDASG